VEDREDREERRNQQTILGSANNLIKEEGAQRVQKYDRRHSVLLD
jgi:hypothetical protein